MSKATIHPPTRTRNSVRRFEGKSGKKIEKEKKREREKEKERGEKWEGKKERTRSKFPCLFLLDSFSLLGWSFVASRLRETQVREKKGGGEGWNDVEKGEIPSTRSESSSTRRRRRRRRVSRRYYSMCFLERNDPPPLPVKTLLLLSYVSTDRTTRDNSLALDLTLDRSKFPPMNRKLSGTDGDKSTPCLHKSVA